MEQTKLLLWQTKDAYKWANQLVEGFPSEKWDDTPENLNTNLTWQVGHLLLSFNFHSIMTIKGPQTDLYQKFPIQEYAQLFVKAHASECVGKTDPKALLEHFKLVQEKSLEIISQLSENELNAKLEPTQVPHPIAKNKLEALDWNIKHTMWHCGQIGILKRLVVKRHDFGLKSKY
ncbi:DinB family protein [Flammeovirga sp. SJP92]|uniref:DinB family protein n=1 Tax=Flammeovirga sp. SJP92 TaxID=1775430 RepID=UPI000788DFBA|nr:DinB family protein [Flammeovirga sp. SJP92]KXX70923.1 hypothetical protein AVL50_11165 [Flammeovirga sp. SJP92]